MKPLLPTLKERQRYIVYEVVATHAMQSDISEQLLSKLSEILGVFGMADAGILSVSYDAPYGVLRVNHDQVSRVKAALLLVTHLGRTQVIVRTLGVSGMINKAKRFLPERVRRKYATNATPNDGI